MIKKIINKIHYIGKRIQDRLSLSDGGERVDIDYSRHLNTDSFDMYQKSHYARYEFAKNLLQPTDIVGDFACGTGYGTSMLSENSTKVIGVDINTKVVKTIQKRYVENKKIEFFVSNILNINYLEYFNKIISFETVEHIDETLIPDVFKIYYRALKIDGVLVFSVPYMQKMTKEALEMGFHKTFLIDEHKIQKWLDQAGFKKSYFKYQNYKTHHISDTLVEKDFIICVASK